MKSLNSYKRKSRRNKNPSGFKYLVRLIDYSATSVKRLKSTI